MATFAVETGAEGGGLSAIYVATLVALVGVLASQTLRTTPFGLAIGALFEAEVLGFLAIAVYIGFPMPNGAFGAG
jgi:hypothetical protein